MCYHLISMKWFKRWSDYTRCPKDEEEKIDTNSEAKPKHPGPINLSSDIKNFTDQESIDKLDLSDDFCADIHLK